MVYSIVVFCSNVPGADGSRQQLAGIVVIAIVMSHLVWTSILLQRRDITSKKIGVIKHLQHIR